MKNTEAKEREKTIELRQAMAKRRWRAPQMGYATWRRSGHSIAPSAATEEEGKLGDSPKAR
jgi:hypothetical protein